MDILHKSEKEIREMGFFEYVRALTYSTATYHSRRVDLMLKALGGKTGHRDTNEPSITYDRENFGQDPSYNDKMNALRREKANRLREKTKQNRFNIKDKKVK